MFILQEAHGNNESVLRYCMMAGIRSASGKKYKGRQANAAAGLRDFFYLSEPS